MPRESIRIHSDDPNIFDVQVGWTKDSYMQVGLQHFEHRSLAWVLYENQVDRIGEEIRKMIAETDGSGIVPLLSNEKIGKAVLNILDIVTTGPVSSLWTTPNRHEVNDLIRLLRKARDSAYGKDE